MEAKRRFLFQVEESDQLVRTLRGCTKMRAMGFGHIVVLVTLTVELQEIVQDQCGLKSELEVRRERQEMKVSRLRIFAVNRTEKWGHIQYVCA